MLRDGRSRAFLWTFWPVTKPGAALFLWRAALKQKRPEPAVSKSKTTVSGGPIEQLLGSCLEVEPGILMGFVPCNGGNALHEIEDALRLATFLG